MKEGAILMIDALGFRGIWNRPDVKEHEDVFIDGLRKLEHDAAKRAGAWTTGVGALFKTHASFLSDTIVVANEVDRSKAPREKEARAMFDVAVASCCIFASEIIRAAIETPLGLTFRGCVAVGRFFVDGRILMGPAIDEAASLHETAQAALVWLAPSALRAIDLVPGSVTKSNREVIVPWRVPLKGGDVIDTRVVSPFKNGEAAAARNELRDKLLRSFDAPKLDVFLKRQNTREFLAAADTAAQRVLD